MVGWLVAAMGWIDLVEGTSAEMVGLLSRRSSGRACGDWEDDGLWRTAIKSFGSDRTWSIREAGCDINAEREEPTVWPVL